MNDAESHQLLGAYLLGGLPAEEAAGFERHLAGCTDCRAELDRLASLPALLDAIPVADAVGLTAAVPAAQGEPPGEGAVPRSLLAALAGRRRRSRLRWSGALAAVAAACLAVGVLAGPLLGQPARPDASYSVAAADGPQFTVGLVKKNWGTELAVDGTRMPADGVLSLWVKGRDGGEDRACAWTATPGGKVRITGATPLPLADIASIEMRDARQQAVAVITVPHP